MADSTDSILGVFSPQLEGILWNITITASCFPLLCQFFPFPRLYRDNTESFPRLQFCWWPDVECLLLGRPIAVSCTIPPPTFCIFVDFLPLIAQFCSLACILLLQNGGMLWLIENTNPSTKCPFSTYSSVLVTCEQRGVFIHRALKYCNGDSFVGCMKQTTFCTRFCNCNFCGVSLQKDIYSLYVGCEHTFFNATVGLSELQWKMCCKICRYCIFHNESKQQHCVSFINSIVVTGHWKYVEKLNNWYRVHGFTKWDFISTWNPDAHFGNVLCKLLFVM